MPPKKVPNPSHGRTHIGTVYLGGIFVDGGGIEISPTRHGGFVVKRIPPRQPAFERLGAVAAIYAHAEGVKSPELKAQLLDFANVLANEGLAAPTQAGE